MLVQSFLNAASDGDLITVDRILRDGMPVDVSDDVRGNTALHCATAYNRIELVKLLLLQGADVNRQNLFSKSTPLHYAAKGNSTEVARLLLQGRADINKKTTDNKTPRDQAEEGSEVERLLMELQQSPP